MRIPPLVRAFFGSQENAHEPNTAPVKYIDILYIITLKHNLIHHIHRYIGGLASLASLADLLAGFTLYLLLT